MINTRNKVKYHELQLKRKPDRDPKQTTKILNEHITIHKKLDSALWKIRQALLTELTYEQNKQDNLTKNERKALNELNNPNIINKADKGNTVVVEDRTQYINNALTHLNDPTIYTKQKSDPTLVLKETIKQKLHTLYKQGFIQKKLVSLLLPTRTPQNIQIILFKENP